MSDKPTTHWLETNKPSLHQTQSDSITRVTTSVPSRKFAGVSMAPLFAFAQASSLQQSSEYQTN